MLKGVFTRRFGSICASALGSFCISLWIYELWPSILVCKVHLCNCYREEKHRKKRSFFVANAGSTNDATSFALSACILCVGIFVRKGGVFQGDPPTKKNGAKRNVSILFLEMKSVSIFHFVSKNKIETSLFFCTPKDIFSRWKLNSVSLLRSVYIWWLVKLITAQFYKKDNFSRRLNPLSASGDL